MTSTIECFHTNDSITSTDLSTCSSSELHVISLNKKKSTIKEEFRFALRSEGRHGLLPKVPAHPESKATSHTIEEAFELVVSSITECMVGDATALSEAIRSETKRKHQRDLQKDDFGLFFEQLSRIRLEKGCCDSFSSDEGDDDPLLYYD